MRRPADQAKLLFLYLLRSSSAFATESRFGATAAAAAATATTTTATTTTSSTVTSTTAPVAAAQASASVAVTTAAAAAAASSLLSAAAVSPRLPHRPWSSPSLTTQQQKSQPQPQPPATSSSSTTDAAAVASLEGRIALRVARRSDVPHIQRCNLATLPENYSANFYVQHMRQWPDLALVAEHIPCQRRSSTSSSKPDESKLGSGSESGSESLIENEDIDGGADNNRRRRSNRPPPSVRKSLLAGTTWSSYFNDGSSSLHHNGDCDVDDEFNYGRKDEEEDESLRPRIVGYVLGKVDRGVLTTIPPPPTVTTSPGHVFSSSPRSTVSLDCDDVDFMLRGEYDDNEDGDGDKQGSTSSFLWDALRVRRRRRKSDTPTTLSSQPFFAPDNNDDVAASPTPQPLKRKENLGHVTSLAVLPDFRRRGLAAELMEQLHARMRSYPYYANAVGLHVRVSNSAATKLYGGVVSSSSSSSTLSEEEVKNAERKHLGMGYRVVDVIPEYYQDGEDAYFMRKEFVDNDKEDADLSQVSHSSSMAVNDNNNDDVDVDVDDDVRHLGCIDNGNGRVRKALFRLRTAAGAAAGTDNDNDHDNDNEKSVTKKENMATNEKTKRNSHNHESNANRYRLPKYISLEPEEAVNEEELLQQEQRSNIKDVANSMQVTEERDEATATSLSSSSTTTMIGTDEEDEDEDEAMSGAA